jgi:hypothetical protein
MWAARPTAAFGPWQSKRALFAGFQRTESFGVPCTSRRLDQGDRARLHQALQEVVALHAVLVAGAVRRIRQGRFA